MSDFPEKENIEETTEPTLTPEEGSTVFSDPAEHKKTAVKYCSGFFISGIIPAPLHI